MTRETEDSLLFWNEDVNCWICTPKLIADLPVARLAATAIVDGVTTSLHALAADEACAEINCCFS